MKFWPTTSALARTRHIALVLLIASVGVCPALPQDRNIQAEELRALYGKIDRERNDLLKNWNAAQEFIVAYNELEKLAWDYCKKFQTENILDIKMRQAKNLQANVAVQKLTAAQWTFSAKVNEHFRTLIRLLEQL